MPRKVTGILTLVAVLVSVRSPAARFVGVRAGFSSPAIAQTIVAYPMALRPDQLILTGDVSTSANTSGQCTEPRMAAAPVGTIMLGVKPTSCSVADWTGGSATANVFLPDVYSPTLLTITVSWPDRDGKGLHSPERNHPATITLNGRTLWSKRTTRISTFSYYYAAEHEPIALTAVLRGSATHTLRFSVPPKTAWDLSEIHLQAYPLPSGIQGVGYSPYRDCQYPGGGMQPTRQDVEDDLFRLVHTNTAIRTYSSTGINHDIPGLAKTLGLRIFAGAWLDRLVDNPNADAEEISGVIDIANTANPEGVIVGNEYYLRHRDKKPPEPDAATYLLNRILEVKRGVNNKSISIATAEIASYMFDYASSDAIVPTKINDAYRPIIDQVDTVLVHIYPFWDKLPIDSAAALTVNRYKALQDLLDHEYPGQHKRLIIGETGWPSAGEPNELAVPSLANQQRYMREFLTLAAQGGVEFFYFDAFDELWKIEEGGRVGQHWGYSYTDRTAKYNVVGVLVPADQMPPAEDLSSEQTPLPVADVPGQTFGVTPQWPGKTHEYGDDTPQQFVPSGFMGDTDSVSISGCDRSDPHSGEFSVRATFAPTGIRGWGGAYWQYPANNWGDSTNWGDKNGGINLTWANEVTFWAKGEHGGERIQFLVGGIGTASNPYPDSLRPATSTGFVQLDALWRQYTINLRQQDLTHVIGGFGWSTDKCANPTGATFYLADVFYQFDPALPPVLHGAVLPVYTDAAAQDNHFVPSGWMGDAAVPGRMSLTQCWTDNPHSGKTAIKIAYTQRVIGWAGAYWMHPAENWGDRPGGLDLTGAKRVTFWARSDQPNTKITFLVGGIGYVEGVQCSTPSQPYPDSVCPKISQNETLSTEWKQYTIDLSRYPRDLNRVVGGFGWVAETPVVFYLDDIEYEFE